MKGRLIAFATMMGVLLTACGGGNAAALTSVTPRPIVISSTATPGPIRPTPASAPADPNSTVLTPYATSTLPAATAAAQQTTVAGNQVRISDFTFTPPTIDVSVGTKITWTNAGPSNHTVTANDGSFDSGTIQRNATFTFTPTKPGTFAYHCSIHPTMQGTIVVH